MDDTTVLNEENMFQLSAYLEQSGRVAVADSAYRQTTSVMTPFPQPSDGAQASYQASHIRTRTAIERTIGQLKNSQRCLLNTLNFEPVLGGKIFATTAAVFNIKKLTRNELIELELLSAGYQQLRNPVHSRLPDPNGATGAEYRRAVADQCFS